VNNPDIVKTNIAHNQEEETFCSDFRLWVGTKEKKEFFHYP